MWNKRDDRLRQNVKYRKALRVERLSMYLWDQVAIEAAAQGTDGLVTVDMIEDVAHDLRLTADEVQSCIRGLVESGFWHTKDNVQKCHCKTFRARMEADGFFFHDWWDWNPTSEQARIPIETLRWRRREALKHDRVLCTAIQRRDGDRCRYCGVQVKWTDRSGPKGATYDHLDPNCFEPNNGNFLNGIVVACRKCNGEKKNRTPDEWEQLGGRPLQPEPHRDGTESGLGRDQVHTQSRGRAARETGRAGSTLGHDQVTTNFKKPANGGVA